MKRKILIESFVLALYLPCCCWASFIYVIDPADDGDIGRSGHVYTSGYLLADSLSRIVIEFPLMPITGIIEEAFLTVNPYGLPLWDKTVEVYGYESYDGVLTLADYEAGEFLGIWELPNIDFGEDTFFNVTDFLQRMNSSFVGFNLRTEGVDCFCSLETNYGHPSQLRISIIPEPATLLLLGFGGFALMRRRRQA